MAVVSLRLFTRATLLVLLYYGLAPLIRTLKVTGAFRRPASSSIENDDDFVVIDDTINCEDLHFHADSNTLFTACEDTTQTRLLWFPPLAVFKDLKVVGAARGSIHVIDPDSKKSTRLSFENYSGPFVAHGIDVISDPERPTEAVYIFAVNHPANPDYPWDNVEAEDRLSPPPQARSRAEIFHHIIGSKTVKHIRSIEHPLIRTPNDIVAEAPDSIFLTNDHYYREGWMRFVEDAYAGAKWTDIVHIRVTDFSADKADGIQVSTALDKVHNANGLGHGRVRHELLTTSCTEGVLHICEIYGGKPNRSLRIIESVTVDSTIDNPGYFRDPFADNDADMSGILLPGLTRGIELSMTHLDPSATEAVMIWYFKPKVVQNQTSGNGSERWDKRLLFEDDGTRIRSASAAVLIAIDPQHEAGKRKAWLFVTGFLSRSMIAVKVDL